MLHSHSHISHSVVHVLKFKITGLVIAIRHKERMKGIFISKTLHTNNIQFN